MLFSRERMAMIVAEFLGTGLLVMVALVLTQTTAVSYFIATSLAVTLAVLYLMFSGVSGGHLNPAITFGLWTARRVPTIQAATYLAAQLLGGLGAWQLYQYLTDRTLTTREITYSNPMLVAEIVGTAVLAMAFAAVISRRFDSLQSTVVIGAAFFVGIMIAAVASLAYLNPAIALGAQGWSTVSVLGPLVGGLVGVNLYLWLFGSRATKRRS